MRALPALLCVLFLAGCAGVPDYAGPPRKEIIDALTESGKLIRFNAGQPQKILSSKPISGLAPGEKILGTDYRIARGVLYVLGASGRLYTINTANATATQVGGVFAVALDGDEFGFDFNPTVDRIRVVSDRGQNLRLHPDTGAVVDSNAETAGVQIDGRLAYAAGDTNAGKTPRIVAAAYTYNKANDKMTTNYAIDAAQGTLITQGSREGMTPPVSPNSGQLFTVGKLGVGPFERAAFDITDMDNSAFAAVSTGTYTHLYVLNLETGHALFIGNMGAGEIVRAIAVQP